MDLSSFVSLNHDRNNMSKYIVFISEAFDTGWVIERLTNEICRELNQRNVASRVGRPDEYADEPIVLQSKFLYARAFEKAHVNTAFVTHIDDRLKEMEARDLRRSCNSFLCMSPEDAQYLVGLGFKEEEVVGLDLPFFESSIEPIKLAVFSRCYSDGRKNERWLLSWADRNPLARDRIIFSFLGAGWLPTAQELERKGWSIEVLSPARSLSREYELQLRALRSADYYLYLGFDGGALGTYDAFREGVPIIASRVSYHFGLSGPAVLCGGPEDFWRELSAISMQWEQKRAFVEARSMPAFVDGLLAHWRRRLVEVGGASGLLPACGSDDSPRSSVIDRATIVEEYRRNHAGLSAYRILGTLKRFLQRRK